MTHHVLDVKRLLCPMPVIRTQDKVKQLMDDDTLDVVCTDPGVLVDIPTWCRINGHKILNVQQEAIQIVITLKVCKKEAIIN